MIFAWVRESAQISRSARDNGADACVRPRPRQTGGSRQGRIPVTSPPTTLNGPDGAVSERDRVDRIEVRARDLVSRCRGSNRISEPSPVPSQTKPPSDRDIDGRERVRVRRRPPRDGDRHAVVRRSPGFTSIRPPRERHPDRVRPLGQVEREDATGLQGDPTAEFSSDRIDVIQGAELAEGPNAPLAHDERMGPAAGRGRRGSPAAAPKRGSRRGAPRSRDPARLTDSGAGRCVARRRRLRRVRRRGIPTAWRPTSAPSEESSGESSVQGAARPLPARRAARSPSTLRRLGGRECTRPRLLATDVTAKTCHVPGTPFSSCADKSSNPNPDPVTSSFVVLVAMISPASARDITRAPITTAIPCALPAWSAVWPVWIPARSRSPVPGPRRRSLPRSGRAVRLGEGGKEAIARVVLLPAAEPPKRRADDSVEPGGEGVVAGVAELRGDVRRVDDVEHQHGGDPAFRHRGSIRSASRPLKGRRPDQARDHVEPGRREGRSPVPLERPGFWHFGSPVRRRPAEISGRKTEGARTSGWGARVIGGQPGPRRGPRASDLHGLMVPWGRRSVVDPKWSKRVSRHRCGGLDVLGERFLHEQGVIVDPFAYSPAEIRRSSPVARSSTWT